MASPTSPDDNLTQFFGNLATFAATPGTPTPGQIAGRAATLAGFFCGNSAGPPVIPAIGITNHGVPGPKEPYFTGQTAIQNLWIQFYTSFQPFTFAPTTVILPGYPAGVQAPRLYAAPTYPTQGNRVPMIAVQCDLSGIFVKSWFNHQSGHASPPLSQIPPAADGLPTQIAACAVFAFGQDHLITRLWIYMDRYKLQTDLGPGASAVVAGYFKGLENWEKTLAEVSAAKHGKKR
jgi:hypothetical protein